MERSGRKAGDLMEQRGREKDGGDVLSLDRTSERRRREENVARDDHQCAAVQESAPDFEGRNVKARIADLRQSITRAELYVIGVAHERTTPR